MGRVGAAHLREEKLKRRRKGISNLVNSVAQIHLGFNKIICVRETKKRCPPSHHMSQGLDYRKNEETPTCLQGSYSFTALGRSQLPKLHR